MALVCHATRYLSIRGSTDRARQSRETAERELAPVIRLLVRAPAFSIGRGLCRLLVSRSGASVATACAGPWLHLCGSHGPSPDCDAVRTAVLTRRADDILPHGRHVWHNNIPLRGPPLHQRDRLWRWCEATRGR
jgi:hypothetical protein